MGSEVTALSSNSCATKGLVQMQNLHMFLETKKANTNFRETSPQKKLVCNYKNGTINISLNAKG